MGTATKPPESAEELLERYAAGERSFQKAQLRKANFADANLTGALLKGADLADANLTGANLTRVNFADTLLARTVLTGANLDYAYLGCANLIGAKLERASLVAATLADTNLLEATLTNANLSLAGLEGAYFHRTGLAGVRFDGAMLSDTLLLDVDLTPFCEASQSVVHEGPSTIDHRSILRSLRCPSLKDFLQKAGVPEVFIEYMIDCARTLDPQGVFKMLQSTFISYGGPDTDFAQRLNDALLKNGVTTFFFAKDAIPGRKLHRLMREGVNQHDRVILVCSKASLDRPGVLNEIGETLARESRDGGKEYLIPITLDDYVFGAWKPEDPGIAQAIRDRVVADFRGAETDPVRFNEGVLRLIAALKR